jgi:hypothetical protein
VTLDLAYTFLILFLLGGQPAGEGHRRRTFGAPVAMSGRPRPSRSIPRPRSGDRIAVHIARAVGADDCRSATGTGREHVITLGYEPPERRGALNESYAVDDFPATRRVLEMQQPAGIDVDDPAADPDEVRYLISIGIARWR